MSSFVARTIKTYNNNNGALSAAHGDGTASFEVDDVRCRIAISHRVLYAVRRSYRSRKCNYHVSDVDESVAFEIFGFRRTIMIQPSRENMLIVSINLTVADQHRTILPLRRGDSIHTRVRLKFIGLVYETLWSHTVTKPLSYHNIRKKLSWRPEYVDSEENDEGVNRTETKIIDLLYNTHNIILCTRISLFKRVREHCRV